MIAVKPRTLSQPPFPHFYKQRAWMAPKYLPGPQVGAGCEMGRQAGPLVGELGSRGHLLTQTSTLGAESRVKMIECVVWGNPFPWFRAHPPPPPTVPHTGNGATHDPGPSACTCQGRKREHVQLIPGCSAAGGRPRTLRVPAQKQSGRNKRCSLLPVSRAGASACQQWRQGAGMSQ